MFNKPVPHPKAVNDERGGTGLYIYNESSIHCRVSNPPIVNNNLVKNFCCIVFLLSSFMRSFMRRHSHGLVGYDASLTPMRSRVRFSVIVLLPFLSLLILFLPSCTMWHSMTGRGPSLRRLLIFLPLSNANPIFATGLVLLTEIIFLCMVLKEP